PVRSGINKMAANPMVETVSTLRSDTRWIGASNQCQRNERTRCTAIQIAVYAHTVHHLTPANASGPGNSGKAPARSSHTNPPATARDAPSFRPSRTFAVRPLDAVGGGRGDGGGSKG